LSFCTRDEIATSLLIKVPADYQASFVDFVTRLYTVYADLHFTSLKIRAFVYLDPSSSSRQPIVHYLDVAAKLDQVK